MPSPSASIKQQKAALREQLRSARRALTSEQQTAAAKRVADLLIDDEVFKSSQRVAMYAALDGELSLDQTAAIATQLGKVLFLPVINGEELLFRRWEFSDSLQKGPRGVQIPEKSGEDVAADSLDLILTPLVGFDAKGNRLGMGGGYYDRCLTKLRANEKATRVLGVAHQSQACDNIPTEQWDQPLQGLLTDKSLQWF